MSSWPAVMRDSCWLEFRRRVHLAPGGLGQPASVPNLWPVVAEAWAPQPDHWCWPRLVCETPEPALHRPDSSVDGPATTRVLLAEDDVLLREGLASLLDRPGLDVVGQTGTSGWILLLVRDLRPDPTVVDIRRPPTNTTEGLDAARQIRAHVPATAILVLSGHAEVEPAMDGWPPASGSAVC